MRGAWVKGLELIGREAGIARDVVTEIESRLEFLEQVGLGYLTLDRAAPTLSGGEAQRIRLAAQLGSNLQGVCYVLDEPTIGLHPRDNRVLLDALTHLRSQGNTLVVVEHDEDTIRRADHVIDIGPGAGKRGGRVVAQGSVSDLSATAESVTGRFLAQPLKHPLQKRRAISGKDKALSVKGATLHNLKALDMRFPLQRLVAVTGVSGSGKSTLARDVLLDSVAALVSSRGQVRGVGLQRDRRLASRGPRARSRSNTDRQDAALVPGHLHRLLGRDPQAVPPRRSKPRRAAMRRTAFRSTPGKDDARPAKARACAQIEMSFLPDVKVPCESCHGQRFNPGDAGGELARQVDRRRAAHGSRRGGRVLRLDAGGGAPAATAQGRRPRLPDARPAVTDAVRR